MSAESTSAAAESWTIRRVLAWTSSHFEKKGVDAPRLTAERLLSHCLSLDRVRLYVDLDRPLAKTELQTYRALIERRSSGEPTQYLTGRQEFYGLSFRVDARVLIPRPETELLVEEVLQATPKGEPRTVADLCTGSGCIAVSLARHRPLATIYAVDLSEAALELAKENAHQLKVAERITFALGDLLAPLPPELRFDTIVSNPPYIATAEIAELSTEVRKEPRLALDGGADGLALLRRLAHEAKGRLVPGGLLALEIGDTQGAAVRALLVDAGYEQVRIDKDLERRDRMAFARTTDK